MSTEELEAELEQTLMDLESAQALIFMVLYKNDGEFAFTRDEADEAAAWMNQASGYEYNLDEDGTTVTVRAVKNDAE